MITAFIDISDERQYYSITMKFEFLICLLTIIDFRLRYQR
jgi:hypothetical protein